MKGVIKNLQKSDTWKIQLTVTINFISSKDHNDEESEMHSISDNIKVMIIDEADEVVENLFKSLHNRYQNNLEKSMKGSDFVVYYIRLLYYKCHKINPKCDGSYRFSELDKILKSNNKSYQRNRH